MGILYFLRKWGLFNDGFGSGEVAFNWVEFRFLVAVNKWVCCVVVVKTIFDYLKNL